MFKLIRISVLLIVLLFVAMNAWMTKKRSTDWRSSLWVRIYPMNADGEADTDRYIDSLSTESFAAVAEFLAREAERYGITTPQPVRIELGPQVYEQPPRLSEQPGVVDAMLWSLRMRWWVGSVTDDLETIRPDVRLFVRYHQTTTHLRLENSVGLQKGMFGIVNAYASRRERGRNQVVLVHELLHTVGATDKYEAGSGLPIAPHGLAEPDRRPLFPQRYAEIMGGRIALSPTDAEMPPSLARAVIGGATALEIGFVDSADVPDATATAGEPGTDVPRVSHR